MPVRTVQTLLILASVLAARVLSAAPPQSAWLHNDRKLAGVLHGDSAGELKFQPVDGAALPLRGIRELLFESFPCVVPAAGPVMRVDFRGGERVFAEVQLQPTGLFGLRVASGAPSRVPRAVVAAVAQPPGELLELYEDFESEPPIVALRGWRVSNNRHRAQSGAGSLEIGAAPGAALLELPEPLSSGHVGLAWQDAAEDSSAEWWIDFEFVSGARAATFRIVPGASARVITCLPCEGEEFRTFQVARHPGWRNLTLMFDRDRTLVLVDHWTLAAGPAPPGRLARLRVANAGTSAGQRAELPVNPGAGPALAWLDDLRIHRGADHQSAPGPALAGDLAWLAGGDEVPVGIRAFDARGIEVSAGAAAPRQLSWRGVRGLRFAPAPAPAAPGVHGWLAEIQLAPRLGCITSGNELLVAAIQGVRGDRLVIEHPWLRGVELPLERVWRVVPRFPGWYFLIDPAAHHLGNDLRDDFDSPLPEGTRLERSFELEAIPPGRALLTMHLAEMEPGAGGHGPDQPAAAAARPPSAEHLGTQVFLNDRKLDLLNRHVAVRARSAAPQTVRLAVPPGVLRPGKNVVRIELRSDANDPHEFDDFELSRLALDVEEPAAQAGNRRNNRHAN